MGQSGVNPGGRKWRNAYGTLCMLTVNTVILLVMVNLIAWGMFRVFGPRISANDRRVRFGEEIYRAYPGWERQEVDRLIQEASRLEFAPYVQVHERPTTGRYVNVAEGGYRISPTGQGQGPWPPDRANFNVFCVGGSTTYGSGVTDAGTWPAAMQEILNQPTFGGGGRRVCVYNFGTPTAASSQSRIRLEQLLLDGYKPDVAVFLEGTNDAMQAGTDQPPLSQALRRATERDPVKIARNAARQLLGALPITRLLATQRGLINESEPQRAFPAGVDPLVFGAERFARNVEMIEAVCAKERVGVLVAWQPSPLYRYDVSQHFLMLSPTHYAPLKEGWERAREVFERRAMGRSFVWAADIQEGFHEMLYVDSIHYNPKMNHMVAEFLVKTMRERGLLNGLAN